MCSTWFPRRSLPADVSLPSTGFSGAGSPASPVLSKKLRLRAAHPAALRCLRLAVPQRSLVVSLPGGRVRRRSLELVTRSLPPVLHRGNDTISQVPEEPQLSVCTCSVDSGRIDDTRPLRCRDVAPGDRTARAPTLGLSKLNSMAFGLAAGTVRSMVGFAGRVTPTPRKTHFRPLVRRYRTGFPPARFH